MQYLTQEDVVFMRDLAAGAPRSFLLGLRTKFAGESLVSAAKFARSVGAGEWSVAASSAHRLAGLATNFGAEAFVTFMAHLETEIRETQSLKNPEEVIALVYSRLESLTQDIDEVIAQIA